MNYAVTKEMFEFALFWLGVMPLLSVFAVGCGAFITNIIRDLLKG